MSRPPGAGDPQRLSAGAARELSKPVGAVRTPLLQAIRRLGFTTASEQYSLIEAERGSRLRGLSLTPGRVPVALRITLAPGAAGCTVTIHIEDRWGVPVGRNWGAVSVYAQVFSEVLLELDAALKWVDPTGAESFPAWWRDLPEQDVASLRNAGESAARAEQAVQRRASRLLDGPRSGPRSAVADAGLTTVSFVAPESVAHIPGEIVDVMLTAGQLIAASPGDMPARLVNDVQSVLVALEARLVQLGGNASQAAMTMHVTPADVPVITFLYQQASLRDTLPVRLLMSCTTCRLEKIVNPDLTRMRERSRRVKVLSTSVGAVFGSHNISPFILVGRLAQLKKSEPDFVCLRCQGTDADQTPITFCPRCGDRRAESVLRTCRKCELDMRTLLATASVWRAVEAPPAAPAPAPPLLEWAPPDAAPAVPEPAQWTAPAASAYEVGTRKQRRSPAPVPATPRGWYSDPWRRHQSRYWDGRGWTAQVQSDGVIATDPPA